MARPWVHFKHRASRTAWRLTERTFGRLVHICSNFGPVMARCWASGPTRGAAESHSTAPTYGWRDSAPTRSISFSTANGKAVSLHNRTYLPRDCLFQHLYRQGQGGTFRFADQQMHVLGHDHIPHDVKAIPLTCTLEVCTKASQDWAPPATLRGDYR